jgi:hypothetical protein
MIPMGELNVYESAPIRQRNSILSFVDQALDHPVYVDAGAWLLEAMVDANVIRPTDNNEFRLVRRTPARLRDIERIPRCLWATYKLMTEKEGQFYTLSNRELRPETIVSVSFALEKVVV